MNDKVAIYCRLSEEDKGKTEKEDSESIQNQKNILTSYAFERGWEIYNIYSDDDWSGLDNDRPEWNRMIKDAESKKFNIILSKSQARFTREMESVEKYLHKYFPLWNIRFVGLADFADTNNQGNKKQRQINGLVNEWYCEDLSENIRIVFDKKRRDGLFIGSHASYGYKKDPQHKGKLLIDEEAAQVVKLIYDLYLDGEGSYKITKYLNTKGIPNPTKYKQNNGESYVNTNEKDNRGLWTRTTVKRILKNEMYIGNMVQGIRKKVSYKSKKMVCTPKEDWIVIKGTHEPIIDEQSFLLVQNLLQEHRRHDGKGQMHVLAGKVKCLDCGSSLTRISPFDRTGKIRYKYLRCGMVDKNPQICGGHYIRLDELEKIVLKQLKSYLKKTNDQIIQKALDNQEVDLSGKKLEQEINSIDLQISKVQKIIESLYSDKVSGLINALQFIELNNGFQSDKETLNRRKEHLIEQLNDVKQTKSINGSLMEKINKYKNVEVLMARMVNEFIESIEVGEKIKENNTQQININWKY